jgi:hypothetical protein
MSRAIAHGIAEDLQLHGGEVMVRIRGRAGSDIQRAAVVGKVLRTKQFRAQLDVLYTATLSRIFFASMNRIACPHSR